LHGLGVEIGADGIVGHTAVTANLGNDGKNEDGKEDDGDDMAIECKVHQCDRPHNHFLEITSRAAEHRGTIHSRSATRIVAAA